jgi:hypothetical protein
MLEKILVPASPSSSRHSASMRSKTFADAPSNSSASWLKKSMIDPSS